MILLQFLDQLKFNKYEKDIILFLSSVNSATANQIYKNTKVPQGRIYSVLNQLKNDQIIEIMPTSPKKYKISDIKIALKNYLHKKREEIDEKINKTKEIQTKPKEILDEKETSVRIFLGRKEHIEVAAFLRESAKRELLQIAPAFGSTTISDLSHQRALHRGIKEKIIVKRITPANKKKIKLCLENGGEVRKINTDILALLIKDSSEFLVGVNERGEEERTMVLGKNKALLVALTKVFWDLWKKAKPITLKQLKI